MSAKAITHGWSYKTIPVYLNALEKHYKNMMLKTLISSQIYANSSSKLESCTYIVSKMSKWFII